MKKYFCDSCKKEIEKHVRKTEVPCHLYDTTKYSGMFKSDTYTDNDGNLTSEHMASIDLCQKCYNDFFSAGLKSIKLI